MMNSFIVNKLEGKIVCTDYILEKPIGRGSYGFVYKGMQKSTGDSVAIKIIPKKLIANIPELAYLIPNEIKALSQINCENVIRFYSQQETNTNYYIVMEYCEGGDLYMKLQKQGKCLIDVFNIQFKVDERTALEYFYQVLNGYKAMHQQGVMHRDIKLENIMLRNQQLKIVDFGFAKIFSPSRISTSVTETVLGSPVYMAPELLENKPYGVKAEVYSIGVLLYWMVFGKPPYTYRNLLNPDDLELAMQIKAGKASYNVSSKNYYLILITKDTKISSQLRKLLEGMLEYDVKKRLSFQQIFENEIIKNMWNIDKQRGEGILGMPLNLKNVKFEHEQEEEQKQQLPQKPKIILLDQQMQIDIQDSQLTEFIPDQEFRRLKSQSDQKLLLSEVQYEFIMQNYETELRYLIAKVMRINLLQQSKICFVKIRLLSLAYMIKQLQIGFYKLYDALVNNKNIYNYNNFDSLISFQPYQVLKDQIQNHYYPIIQDYDKFEIGSIIEQLIMDKELSQLDGNLLRTQEFTLDYIQQFDLNAKRIFKQHYEEVNNYVRQMKHTHLNQQQLKEFYQVQIIVLVLYDLKKNFKFLGEIQQFEDEIEKMMSQEKWQKKLKKILEKKQKEFIK